MENGASMPTQTPFWMIRNLQHDLMIRTVFPILFENAILRHQKISAARMSLFWELLHSIEFSKDLYASNRSNGLVRKRDIVACRISSTAAHTNASPF